MGEVNTIALEVVVAVTYLGFRYWKTEEELKKMKKPM
jgi:predicted transcriptional regulator with HTH domain